MNYRKIIIYTVVSLSVVAEWGCSTRKYQRSESVSLPETYHRQDSADVIATQDSSIASIPYKEFFQDEELQHLIDHALIANIDMLVAIKNIESSEESVKQAKLGNLPTITGTIGSASIDRPSDKSMNGTMYSQFLGKKYMESYSTSIGVSWTADIWGKIKAQKQEAITGYLQSEEARKTVQTQLVTNVSQAYYNILLLHEQLKITNETIKLYDSTISITEALQSVGEATQLAVQQQQAAKKAAVASVPQLKQSLEVQEHALCILLGEPPHDFEFQNTLFNAYLKKKFPTGIPAYMVDNRPDVKTAELTIISNLAAEKVAHASMYPQLTISGNGGFNVNTFKNWFDIPGALFVNGLGSLTTPIFSQRQLKTRYNQSKITTDQSILTFKKTVLTALGDVSNSLSSIYNLNDREKELDGQIVELKGAVTNSRLLYENGQSNYLDIITAENSLLQAQLNLADTHRQRLSEVVNLYVSLGGGWK